MYSILVPPPPPTLQVNKCYVARFVEISLIRSTFFFPNFDAELDLAFDQRLHHNAILFAAVPEVCTQKTLIIIRSPSLQTVV